MRLLRLLTAVNWTRQCCWRWLQGQQIAERVHRALNAVLRALQLPCLEIACLGSRLEFQAFALAKSLAVNFRLEADNPPVS